MKTSLIIIDGQKDFCQAPNPALAQVMLAANGGVHTTNIDFVNSGGSLYVPGADKDCLRLATMIDRLRGKIDAIHVTLDSHNEVDIAHPIFWRDNEGNHPAPFTIISKEDVIKGIYSTSNPACLKRATEYVTELETNQRYPLCIWPPHCIIGSNGHSLEQNVDRAVSQWAKERFKLVDHVTKGSNPWTEHYSAIKADVPDPSDPTTLMNSAFVTNTDKADLILVGGQALSHCVANTLDDLIKEFGPDSAKKIVILRDCCSNVPGFEQNGDDFIARVQSAGVRVQNSTEIFQTSQTAVCA